MTTTTAPRRPAPVEPPRLAPPTDDELDQLRNAEWREARPSIRLGAEILAVTITAARARGPADARRGTVSPGAVRFFQNKGVDRVRFAASGDGRFCALEPHITGSKLRGDTRQQLELAMPHGLPVGLIIELSPLRDMLIGRYPGASS